MSLPPINADSPLIAQQPIQQAATDISDDAGGLAFAFDTEELQHALMRSRQSSGACGGLRRAVSAPHSMDTLGWEPGMPLTRATDAAPTSPSSPSARNASSQSYLPPSGGPMRRISSSLGLRRSSSFFWTPAAHHDFERAIHAISARGVEVTANNILLEMGASHTSDLKLADVDKHLRKKMLVQRRVLQQLSTSTDGRADNAAALQPPDSPQVALRMAVAPSFGEPRLGAGGYGGACGAGPSGLPLRSMGAPGLMGTSSCVGGMQMAAVAEEPAGACSGQAEAPASQQQAAQAQQQTAAAAAAAAAVQQAISDSLAQQFNAQRMQHQQLAAAREAMVAGEARMHAQTQA